jgi:hypothetical protein
MWHALVVGLVLGSAGLGVAAGGADVAKPTAEPVAERPACGKENRGQLWPAEANGNPRLANQLARAGQLEMCQKSSWRYGWKSPSVHIRQLADRRKRPK